MPHIRSASPDFKRIDAPSTEYHYPHGADLRKQIMPMAFQVTSPFDFTRALLPHALVMHVNPATFSETFTKKIERIQTKGGWVEQHWGDDLAEVSADGSTGAFMNIYTGLSSVLRHRTIAYDRYRDLHDLFRHNGSVYDPYGNIVLQGQVLLMYDRGTLAGTFRTFEFEETVDSPFAFKVSWTFKVEHIVYYIPGAGSGRPIHGPAARAPAFQRKNTEKAPNAVAQEAEMARLKAEQEKQGREKWESVKNGAEAVYDYAKGVYDYWSKSAEERAAIRATREAEEESAALTDSMARQREEQFKNRQSIPIHTAPDRRPLGGK